jgi:hypothetical protein
LKIDGLTEQNDSINQKKKSFDFYELHGHTCAITIPNLTITLPSLSELQFRFNAKSNDHKQKQRRREKEENDFFTNAFYRCLPVALIIYV